MCIYIYVRPCMSIWNFVTFIADTKGICRILPGFKYFCHLQRNVKWKCLFKRENTDINIFQITLAKTQRPCVCVCVCDSAIANARVCMWDISCYRIWMSCCHIFSTFRTKMHAKLTKPNRNGKKTKKLKEYDIA